MGKIIVVRFFFVGYIYIPVKRGYFDFIMRQFAVRTTEQNRSEILLYVIFDNMFNCLMSCLKKLE